MQSKHLPRIFITIIGALLCFSFTVRAENNPVFIGLDAEFGDPASTSAEAFRRGILIAIDEINQAGGVLNGRPLALLDRDHRTVPARSIENIKELAGNPNVVGIFCGRLSAIVVQTLPTIHSLGIPLLNPWAASAELVDNDYKPNYVFRLSLRDTWAVPVMMQFAEQKGINHIGLLLSNTGWGRSNQKAIEDYVAKNPKIKITDTRWYNWGDKSLLEQYQALRKSGAQAIVAVPTGLDGVVLVKDVASLQKNERLPILSQWGVTGSTFPVLARDVLKEVDFSMVQTYSFIDADNPKAKQVLATAKRLFGVNNARSLLAPVGVAHAYDLTYILALAISKAGSTDRKAIRDALEQVEDYAGLIKHYKQPFTPQRHDALSPDDVFMAKFAPDGAIVRVK